MWRGWRNFKDPADVLGAIGALGMVIFFGALVLSEDDAPLWLLLPALVVAVLGCAGEVIWKYLRRRGEPTTRNDA